MVRISKSYGRSVAGVRRSRRCFTWEEPQHAASEHSLRSVIAVKPKGGKLAAYQKWNVVMRLEAHGRRSSVALTPASPEVVGER